MQKLVRYVFQLFVLATRYKSNGKYNYYYHSRIPSLSTKGGAIVKGSGQCGDGGFAVKLTEGVGQTVKSADFTTKASTVCCKLKKRLIYVIEKYLLLQ